jgi:hypothetical protein
MSILNTLKMVRDSKSTNPMGPGGVKSVLAGLAIAWGSRTAMRVAQDATERTIEATAELDGLKMEREALLAEIDDGHHVLSERLAVNIRDGYADPAVKARAAVLGWAELTGVSDSGYYASPVVDAEHDTSG